MRFWKRKKKEELSEEQITQIVDEYMGLMKDVMGKYLSRQMRRALNKSRGWGSLSSSQKKKEIEEIKQQGLSSWLDKSTEETIEQVSSFVSDHVVLEEELRKASREFKKKWNIK